MSRAQDSSRSYLFLRAGGILTVLLSHKLSPWLMINWMFLQSRKKCCSILFPRLLLRTASIERMQETSCVAGCQALKRGYRLCVALLLNVKVERPTP